MKPASIFTDNIIFAENRPIRVFGESEGDVAVRFRGAEVTARSTGGKWIAEMPESEAGGPYELRIEGDGIATVLRDIYVGRVYLVAGQSNAEFQLCSSNEPESGYINDPLLRNYYIARPWYSPDPCKPGDGWISAEKENVGAWSAIAYLAGRETRRLTGKAVGVITCAQGASIIESWLPAEIAKEFELDADKLMIDHTYPDYAAFNKAGVIYESMLSKILPFSFNGVIWYQGESDTTVAEGAIYDKELASLIRVIREAQNDASLHFAVIQIADFDGRKEYDPEGWTAIQNAQERAVRKDAHASLVISRDVCESTGIHPTRKTELSVRAAKSLLEN